MARSTQEVLEHHLQAFDAKDIDGILADYDDSSIFITPNGEVLRGRAQIRTIFETFIEEMSSPRSSFRMVHEVVEGQIAFLSWTAESAINLYDLGTDTFVVRDGIIRAHTFAVHSRPRH